jgi:hypothetical protein
MIYKSSAAFRQALEDRLLAETEQTRVPLLRLRKMVAFDRFLARLVQSHPDQWLLKGGLALQLRLGMRARTTLDVDVLLLAPTRQLHPMLVQAAQTDLNDWFEFTVRAAAARLPGIGDGTAQRFALTSLLDGRTFEAFHLDVGIGDPVVEAADDLITPPLLNFAGIAPATIPCFPAAQHLAEKLHAYVRPRAGAANTRVKDLIDILLIAEQVQVEAVALRAAIMATFAAQDDTRLPKILPDPPASWIATYRRMAGEVGLATDDLASAITAARRFLDRVLQGQARGAWRPDAQAWV